MDDDATVRAEMAHVLARAGLRTAEAKSGEDALEEIERELPSLVLLDVCLPGISGYQLCHQLKQRFGDGLPIVFATAARTESYDRAAGLLVGGDDYLIKPVAPDELVIRVERLVRRSAPLSPRAVSALTPRELEILRRLADGSSTAEIAAELFLSPRTVSTHIDHVLRKLGVRSRAQAVALAYRRDLVTAAS